MRWEKTRTLSEVTRPLAWLSLPGEALYREWERVYGRAKFHAGKWWGHALPEAKAGPEIFLFRCFVRLQEINTRASIYQELCHLSYAAAIASSHPKSAFTPKKLEGLFLNFWRWQKLLDPAAIKPMTAAANDLEKDMKNWRHVFENTSGIAVSAVDVLGKLR